MNRIILRRAVLCKHSSAFVESVPNRTSKVPILYTMQSTPGALRFGCIPKRARSGFGFRCPSYYGSLWHALNHISMWSTKVHLQTSMVLLWFALAFKCSFGTVWHGYGTGTACRKRALEYILISLCEQSYTLPKRQIFVYRNGILLGRLYSQLCPSRICISELIA